MAVDTLTLPCDAELQHLAGWSILSKTVASYIVVFVFITPSSSPATEDTILNVEPGAIACCTGLFISGEDLLCVR